MHYKCQEILLLTPLTLMGSSFKNAPSPFIALKNMSKIGLKIIPNLTSQSMSRPIDMQTFG